ncbi:MAG: hypothetical protein CMG62_04435 [Candidatus Marinimicrobia bacterium]|nr:hypothetical protein [Candidatus Neomarinimicrobiota bacterium]|tara:strand:+ start:761 stop:1384 length:624 start_codon:yes stop_codon:yes gene_type:complete
MIIKPQEQSVKEIHKLMIGSIVPRPIALVSTISKDNIFNLAPFSYFNGVCSNPPTIVFAPGRRAWDGGKKDTLINIEYNKEFVVNLVSEDFADKMVTCSTDFSPDIDEFSISKLTPKPSTIISAPRVLESKISLECKLNQVVEIGNGEVGSGFLVIGTILLFHIDDKIFENGKINLDKLSPIGRLAGNWYSKQLDRFEIERKIKPEK